MHGDISMNPNADVPKWVETLARIVGEEKAKQRSANHVEMRQDSAHRERRRQCEN